MSDEKTSQFPDAAELDGAELVGIVQGGANVQTTTLEISNTINDRSYVQIGQNANAGGETGVAIGFYASSFGPAPISIGNSAYTIGLSPIAIGYRASAPNNGAIAVGSDSYTHGAFALALGNRAGGNGGYSIAVGAYANAETHSIAIGAYSHGWNTYSIAIGVQSKAYSQQSIAVGTDSRTQGFAAIAIGANSYAQYKSVAIGYRSRCNYDYSVSIGNWAEAIAGYSIAIGTYTYTTGIDATAIGPYCSAQGNDSVAIGAYSRARFSNSAAIGAHTTTNAVGSFALGAFANTAQDNSTVIGSSSTDMVVGSFVVCGYPTEFSLHPSDHYQKFVGQTIPAVAATAEWSGDGWTITVSYPGNAGNGLYAEAVPGGSANQSLSVNLEGNTLVIILGTDSDGDADPTKNTIAQIAALFPSNGFSFGFTGSSDTVISDLELTHLSGGADNTPSVSLTADGGGPSTTNVPAINGASIATLTGRVTGAGGNIFSESDDAASFVLTPLLLYCDNVANYHFIGTPTFTLENSTEGAIDWPLPTLSIVDSSNLQVDVVNNAEIINWMAHFKFETS